MLIVRDNESRLRLTARDESAAAFQSVPNNVRQLQAQMAVTSRGVRQASGVFLQ
jgi:hypothetical protein